MPVFVDASKISHALCVLGYAQIMSTLAQRIKRIRAECGLTQGELGRLANVKTQSVQQWENGATKNIRMEPLFAIQRNLGYSAEWIATGDGDIKTQCQSAQTDCLDMSGLTSEQKASLSALLAAFNQQKDFTRLKSG